MSDDLPVLEDGNEPCPDKLPSAPSLPESVIDQALEALHLRGAAPVSEVTNDKHEPLTTDPSKPAAEHSSQSHFPTPTKRRAKRLPTKNASRLSEALRSRRLRILATAVGGLLVVGLIGWNWRRSDVPASGDELAEMDLADFEDDLHLGATGTARTSEPKTLEGFTGVEPALHQSRVSQSDSGGHLQPAGFVNASDQSWPSASFQNSGRPSPPPKRGSQAAWLTGQIEFESIDTPQDESPSRRSDFGESR